MNIKEAEQQQQQQQQQQFRRFYKIGYLTP